MVWDSASPRHKKMAIDYYDRKLLHSFIGAAPAPNRPSLACCPGLQAQQHRAWCPRCGCHRSDGRCARRWRPRRSSRIAASASAAAASPARRAGGAGPRRGSAQVPLESCHEASAAEFQARAEGLLQGPGRQLHGAAHEQGCVGGVGVRRLTKAPRAGKFIIDPDKVVRLVRTAASCRAREGRPRNASPAQVVPDLEGFKLKPYVAAAVPKMPYPLATAQLRRRAGAGADDDAAP